MIPIISSQRVINQWHKLRCFSCCTLLPLLVSDDYYIKCEKCGQIHDCKPVNYFRAPLPPTHKIVSSLLPSGRVVRRRVPLGIADKQLDLFGGV